MFREQDPDSVMSSMRTQTAPAVLIVEDEPMTREMACHMFQEFGCHCFDAYNGEDALRILSAHPEIELLFADVRMPGLSGIELAREAQRMRPHLRVVLTSGWLAGAPIPDLPFVRKPYRLHDLREIVVRAFSRHH
jgi:CheY-like chemotaxis protein